MKVTKYLSTGQNHHILSRNTYRKKDFQHMSKIIYHRSHKYIRWYLNLVRSRLISQPSENIQKHHYFPCCIFGNRKINKATVPLTPREHFIAHKILTKIYFHRITINPKAYKKILRAFSAMGFNKNGDRITSRMMNEVCEATRQCMMGANNPSVKYGIRPEHRKKLSIASKGVPHSKEHVENLKKSHERRKARGDVYFSEETRFKIKQAQRQTASRFDFHHENLNITETYISTPEMVDKYPEMKLCASNLRKSQSSKGWIKTKTYPGGKKYKERKDKKTTTSKNKKPYTISDAVLKRNKLSVERQKQRAAHYDFYHKELNLTEIHISAPELARKYPEQNLKEANLKKSTISKGWIKTKVY